MLEPITSDGKTLEDIKKIRMEKAIHGIRT